MPKRTVRTTLRAAATGAFALALTGLAPCASEAAAAPAVPQAPPRAGLAAAHEAATAPATLDTLARFFAAEPGAARESGAARRPGGAVPKGAPHIEGAAVPVYVLSPDFVRGRAGAPVARLEFLASKAVAADGRTASVWTVRRGTAWKVVNIASGDDETRYAEAAGDKAGTVFHEPQIDAWYVQRGERIEPLDAHARKAVGAHGTTVAAYRERVMKAYGDKLPGSAYDKRGEAGGYGPGGGGGAGGRAPKGRARADGPGQGGRRGRCARGPQHPGDGRLRRRGRRRPPRARPLRHGRDTETAQRLTGTGAGRGPGPRLPSPPPARPPRPRSLGPP